MGPERQVGNVVSHLPGDLDQHGGIVDARIGDPYAQPDVSPAAPSSRSHEDEGPPWKDGVQPAHGVSNGDQGPRNEATPE